MDDILQTHVFICSETGETVLQVYGHSGMLAEEFAFPAGTELTEKQIENKLDEICRKVI